MKKILIISGSQVFPPLSGGQLRTASLAQGLAHAGFDVSLYSLTGRKAEYLSGSPSSRQIIEHRLSEFVDRSRVFGLFQWATYRLGLPDLWIHLPFPAPKALADEIRECDVLIADFPFTARFASLKKSGLRVLNCHNLEFERYGKSFWSQEILVPLMQWLERKAAQRVDLVLVTSEHEKRFYDSLQEVLLIPNGIQPKIKVPKEEARKTLGFSAEDKVVLFAASKYGPNSEALEALEKFAQENAAWLRSHHWKFLVAGSVSSKAFSDGALVVTGPVPEMAPYFSAADYAINPIQTGSGTNLKISEYVMAQLPTLTTEFGKRGFDLSDGEDCVVFDWKNLRTALERIVQLNPEQLAHLAYEKNKHRIDMNSIVRDRLSPRF